MKYHKGSEMHIADFLSRNVDNDTDDPHEVIHITFVANDLFLHITDQNTSLRPELKEFLQCVRNMFVTNVWSLPGK